MLVKLRDRGIADSRRRELIERLAAWFQQPSRLIFKECLIGGHLSRLRGPGHAFKFLQTLPAQPAEFMVVPHADKGPAGAGVLQVRVMQVRAVDGAVVADVGRDMKVADFFAVLVADDIPNAPVVHALWAIFRIPDKLINEITKV